MRFSGLFEKRWYANVVFSHGERGEVVVICMATNARFSGLKKVPSFKDLFFCRV
jgi:hypothetical protein